MFSNEKFSKDLTVFWDKVFIIYPSTYLKTFCELIRQIDNNPSLRKKLTFENASIILQQLMILIYNEHNVSYNLEEMRQTIRECMYLLKNTILSDNLSNERRCLPCFH